MRTTMDEATSNFWTTIFGGITALGLIAGGIYTLVEYRSSRNEQRLNVNLQLQIAQQQASQAFWSKQLELCTELSDAAGTLAVSKIESEKTKAANTFYTMFWGSMGLVEGQDLSQSVTDFKNCLEGKCSGGQPLEKLASQIATNCRKEMEAGWKISLPHKTPGAAASPAK
jgi:hypothetical protein